MQLSVLYLELFCNCGTAPNQNQNKIKVKLNAHILAFSGEIPLLEIYGDAQARVSGYSYKYIHGSIIYNMEQLEIV